MRRALYDFNFFDVNWGPDEARGDYSLSHYFVEYPGFSKVLFGSKRYIIGRKGTGKTAVLQKILTMSEQDPSISCTSISLRDFPINDFRSLGDKRYRDKTKYVPAWKLLILVEISRLVLKDESIPNDSVKQELHAFISTNFPNDISIANTLSTLKEKSNKLSVAGDWLGGEHSGRNSTSATCTVHYQMVVKALEKKLYGFCSNTEYFILADELDEGYKNSDKDLKLIILSLLRACEDISLFFQSSRLICRPVVALRSDIFDNLEDNDLNKLDDYVMRLNWTIDEHATNSLKRIIERRIRYSFQSKYPDEEISDEMLWRFVFDDSSSEQGLFKYMSIHTFDRPRDIVKLLKYCQEIQSPIKQLTQSMVAEAEERYSAWLYNEFRDEIQSFMSCWKSVLNCLTEITQGKDKISRLVEVLEANDEVKNWLAQNNKTAINIIEILFEYSVIGCINDRGRWLFKYKNEHLEFMRSYPYYCIHFGFLKKLRVVKSYRPQILAEINTL